MSIYALSTWGLKMNYSIAYLFCDDANLRPGSILASLAPPSVAPDNNYDTTVRQRSSDSSSKLVLMLPQLVKVCMHDTKVRQSQSLFIDTCQAVRQSSSEFVREFVEVHHFSPQYLVPDTRLHGTYIYIYVYICIINLGSQNELQYRVFVL